MLQNAEMEIHVPLQPTAHYKAGSKPEFDKAIREAYAMQYLEALGIEPTDDRKRSVTRGAPLGACAIEAVWEDPNAKTGSNLRILQPLHSRGSAPTSDQSAKAHRVMQAGEGLPANIWRPFPQMPPMPSIGPAPAKAAANAVEPFQEEFLIASEALDEKYDAMSFNAKLVEELEKVRRQASGNEKRDEDTTSGHVQWGEEGMKQLEVLKQKFILPFAIERPTRRKPNGERATSWLPWQSPDLQSGLIEVPPHMLELLSRPPQMTLPDILTETIDHVKRGLPLELLTARSDPALFAAIRESLSSSEATRLIGLLSHLLYWSAFSHLHKPQDRLPQKTRQSLVLTLQAVWSGLIEPTKRKVMRHGTDSVACFIIPAYMLAMKKGVEEVFNSQYPAVFKDLDEGPRLTLALIDQLNVLMMNVFDPDCAFASFGFLDSTAEAQRLWRKLSLSLSKLGLTPAGRIIGKGARTTPMVTLLMNADANGPAAAETRMLLRKSCSDTVLAAVAGPLAERSRAPPTLDEPRRLAACKTAFSRLSASGRQVLSGEEAQGTAGTSFQKQKLKYLLEAAEPSLH